MSSFGSFLGQALGLVGAFVGGPVGWWLLAASVAVNVVNARSEARRAERAARSAHNASLEDRLEMVDITPDQPRTRVYGRVRCVEGVRRRWVSGANSEKLTIVVSFAGHEIDGFEAFYFDDVELTLDAQGYVTNAPYSAGKLESFTAQGVVGAGGVAIVSIPSGAVASSLVATWALGLPSDNIGGQMTLVSVDVQAGQATFSGDAGVGSSCIVTGQHAPFKPTARIRAFTGAPGQNVGAALAAEYGGKITATDRFAGMAVAVVDLDYDPDVYPQGRPNVTARLRGARVYDPRRDTTVPGGSGTQRLADPASWAFSENPALHAYDFARTATGWAVPAEEIDRDDVVSAADACDVPTAFTLRKTGGATEVVNLPRYRSGAVIKCEGERAAGMEELMAAMAGRWGWAGGKLRFRAGQRRPVVFALDPSWIAQRLGENGEPDTAPVVRLVNGVAREQRVNRVSGRCVHPAERWQALPFPAVEDPVLIARDGAVHALELEMAAVSHPAHAQHLASVRIRQAQAALTMKAQCNLAAFRCELFDVGSVTLPRFGMTGKLFEVHGWRWHPTEGVQLTLAEITDAIYEPLAELRGVDPAPNSTLRAPWDVQPLAGLTVESGTVALSDGSVLVRTRVQWAAATQASVLAGGQIEVQYCEQRTGQWQSWFEQGSATQAIIPGLRADVLYIFKVRAVQGVPMVRGPWSPHVMHRVAAVATVEGRYTSWIFKRSATRPDTPEGNGLPLGWADAPPEPNGQPLWVSKAEMSAGAVLLGPWSVPVQLEGASISAEFSFDGLTNWHSPALASDRWMRISADNGVTWGEPIRIAGEDGIDGINGPPGPPGTRTATLVLYQWAPAAPTVFPTGTSFYRWSTGTFTGPSQPNGWSAIPGAPSPGFTLWAVQQTLVDQTLDFETEVTWGATTLRAVGQAGTTGIRGSVTGYSATVYPPVYSLGTPWTPGDEWQASLVIWRMRGGSGDPPSTAHLVIGDTVTLTNAAVTQSATRYWTGGSWVDPGQVISGNLIVGGTISGQTNFAVAGFSKIEGGAPYTVANPMASGAPMVMSVASIANTLRAQTVGVVGYGGGGSFAYGVLGVGSTSGLGTPGTAGVGDIGVLGVSYDTPGALNRTGVMGRGANYGVVGRGNGSGTGVDGDSDSGWGGSFKSLRCWGELRVLSATYTLGLVSTNGFLEAQNGTTSAYLHGASGRTYVGVFSNGSLAWPISASATDVTLTGLRLNGASIVPDGGGGQALRLSINGSNFDIAITPA